MNIALRPSGGRGEYELAGKQGELSVRDLFELPIFLEILPSTLINAHSKCELADGKPRIRLDPPKVRDSHPAPLITSAMMLPKPRRERVETGGVPLLRWHQYVVQIIRIDVIPHPKNVVIRPVSLRLENATGERLDMSFADRMTRVLRVWTAAAAVEGPVADAVRAHATAFTSTASSAKTLVQAYTDLRTALDKPDGDMLPILEAEFGTGVPELSALGAVIDEPTENEFVEDVHLNPLEARIERVRQWRLCSVRGGAATAFRRDVMQAYNWRCLFSGQRLPRTKATLAAGVDAAHILPWSRFDLDATSNGLCLSKQSHWAFDTGLFRLNYDEGERSYVVSIPDSVRLAAAASQFDLGSFDEMSGVIPRNRLPANEALWPSRHYITKLNRFLDGEAA